MRSFLKQIQQHNPLLETTDSSVVKSTCCSCKDPRFSSWHPHVPHHHQVSPDPGNLMQSSGLQRHCMHSAHTDKCRQKYSYNTQINLKHNPLSFHRDLRTINNLWFDLHYFSGTQWSQPSLDSFFKLFFLFHHILST